MAQKTGAFIFDERYRYDIRFDLPTTTAACIAGSA